MVPKSKSLKFRKRLIRNLQQKHHYIIIRTPYRYGVSSSRLLVSLPVRISIVRRRGGEGRGGEGRLSLRKKESLPPDIMNCFFRNRTISDSTYDPVRYVSLVSLKNFPRFLFLWMMKPFSLLPFLQVESISHLITVFQNCTLLFISVNKSHLNYIK